MNSEDTAMNEPTTKSWRDLIPVHPAAEMFPMMSDAELKELGEDIKANGLREPISILTDSGCNTPHSTGDNKRLLLDGRNRLEAMERAGILFDAWGKLRKQWHGGKVFNEFPASRLGLFDRASQDHVGVEEFISSKNTQRRHLTAEQRRNLTIELLKAHPERSNRAIAAETKLDDKTVAAIRRDSEASAEIPHIEPTERVDAGGRKRARKTGEKGKSATAAKSAAKAAGQPVEQAQPVEELAKQSRDLSDEEQVAYKREHPIVDKSAADINRAFKRCSPEERQFLTKYSLPAMLLWFDLENVAPALVFAAEPIEIPDDADLDQLATLFAGLTITQQNDVIDRADRMRDAADTEAITPTPIPGRGDGRSRGLILPIPPTLL